LQAEVADLMAKAVAANAADIPDGMSIPDELARRQERMRKLAEARAKIEARAGALRAGEARGETVGAQSQGGGHGQEARRQASKGSCRGTETGRPHQSQRRRVAHHSAAGSGFDQCDNAQAAVAAGSLLVVAADVIQAPNDKQQLEPKLGKIGPVAEEVGRTRDAAGGHGL